MENPLNVSQLNFLSLGGGANSQTSNHYPASDFLLSAGVLCMHVFWYLTGVLKSVHVDAKDDCTIIFKKILKHYQGHGTLNILYPISAFCNHKYLKVSGRTWSEVVHGMRQQHLTKLTS